VGGEDWERQHLLLIFSLRGKRYKEKRINYLRVRASRGKTGKKMARGLQGAYGRTCSYFDELGVKEKVSAGPEECARRADIIGVPICSFVDRKSGRI